MHICMYIHNIIMYIHGCWPIIFNVHTSTGLQFTVHAHFMHTVHIKYMYVHTYPHVRTMYTYSNTAICIVHIMYIPPETVCL